MRQMILDAVYQKTLQPYRFCEDIFLGHLLLLSQIRPGLASPQDRQGCEQ